MTGYYEFDPLHPEPDVTLISGWPQSRGFTGLRHGFHLGQRVRITRWHNYSSEVGLVGHLVGIEEDADGIAPYRVFTDESNEGGSRDVWARSVEAVPFDAARPRIGLHLPEMEGPDFRGYRFTGERRGLMMGQRVVSTSSTYTFSPPGTGGVVVGVDPSLTTTLPVLVVFDTVQHSAWVRLTDISTGDSPLLEGPAPTTITTDASTATATATASDRSLAVIRDLQEQVDSMTETNRRLLSQMHDESSSGLYPDDVRRIAENVGLADLLPEQEYEFTVIVTTDITASALDSLLADHLYEGSTLSSTECDVRDSVSVDHRVTVTYLTSTPEDVTAEDLMTNVEMNYTDAEIIEYTVA